MDDEERALECLKVGRRPVIDRSTRATCRSRSCAEGDGPEYHYRGPTTFGFSGAFAPESSLDASLVVQQR
jgi:hypothetical protein